jgi:amidohydrolase
VPSRLEKLLGEVAAKDFERLVETRRDLHRHPELAFEERRTAGIAARRLAEAGWEPRERVGKTGVTAEQTPAARSESSSKKGRILLRADMDALPLTEETGAAYASSAPGKMHACGHDGHVAVALSLAERLAGRSGAGRLRFLFQPAEEGAGGAEACAADGVLEGVTAAFGLHLWNQLPLGKVGVNRGALMAAVDEFSIDVTGPGGHGASPHETQDTVLAASRIIEALQSIVAREISPLESAVVTVASIHGGSSFNIIPSLVRLTGTARSFTEAVRDALPKKIERIVAGTAQAAGVSARMEYRRINRATVNDRAMAELVIETAVRLLGPENVETDTRTLGGEDMSVFLDRVPGCFFFVGSAPADGHRPHHSPRFDFDERALAVGVRLFEEIALEAARRL